MKRLLPLCASVAVLLCAMTLSGRPAAADPGINLSWNDCGSFGTADAAFACNTNAGSNQLYASFIPPAGITTLVAAEAVLDITSASAALDPWWCVAPSTGCRAASISAAFSFLVANCTDYWSGQASSGTDYQFNITNETVATAPATNHARLRVAGAIDGTIATSVDPGTEYYAFVVNLSHAKTLGTACTGCAAPVCIVLNSINLEQPAGVGDFLLTAPPTGGRNTVTWQGGAGANCASVPVRTTTWGQIKSLYR